MPLKFGDSDCARAAGMSLACNHDVSCGYWYLHRVAVILRRDTAAQHQPHNAQHDRQRHVSATVLVSLQKRQLAAQMHRRRLL